MDYVFNLTVAAILAVLVFSFKEHSQKRDEAYVAALSVGVLAFVVMCLAPVIGQGPATLLTVGLGTMVVSVTAYVRRRP